MLVTSEKDMDDIDIYNTYHNLWKIEESFKIMKSDLDARPVFLQRKQHKGTLPDLLSCRTVRKNIPV